MVNGENKRTGPSGERCDACYFFQPVYGTMRGMCHSLPPTPVNGATFVVTQPNQDYWCGQFKPKKETAPVEVALAKKEKAKK